MKQRVFAVMLVIALLMLMTSSCVGEKAEEDNAFAAINSSEVTLRVGERKTLSLTISKGIKKSSLTLDWSSSDEEVATVDDKGNVTAVSPGEATVSCTITSPEGKEQIVDCLVTVRIPVSALLPDEKAVSVHPGSSRQLSYTIEPEDASVQTLEWSSQNSEIATVDQNGTVTAVSTGRTRISAQTTDGSKKTLSWDITVPTVYAEQDAYTISKPGSFQIPVTFAGEDFESGYAVTTTGIEIVYETEIVDGKAVFTVTPVSAGEAHLNIRDKKSASDQADILISISNKALYNPERLVITSAELVPGASVLTYKFTLTNHSSEEIGEIGFLVDYRDQFGDTHYLLSNQDGSIANHQYITMFNILPGETKPMVGQNEVFRPDLIKEVRLAICYYRDLTGEKFYIPDSQLFWFSTKTGEMERPEVSSIYIQPDEDTFDRAMRINIGATTCNLYSYVVKDFSRSKRPGVFLASIAGGGNASSWGLQRGDVIYGADDILWTDDPFMLNRALCDIYDGKSVVLKIVRNGEEKEITLARTDK